MGIPTRRTAGPAAIGAGPTGRQLTRPEPDGGRRPATFARTVRTVTQLGDISTDERILAAWTCAGPDPATIARATGTTIAQVLEVMGAASAAGLVCDDGWLAGPDPNHESAATIAVDIAAKSLVLDGTATASPAPSAPLATGAMCGHRQYQLARQTQPEPAPEPTPTPSRPTVPQAIRQGRQAAGLTQRQLAAAVGVTATTVSWWETGKSHPRRHNIRALAAAGITLDSRRPASP